MSFATRSASGVMIFYLVRKYVGILLVVAALLILFPVYFGTAPGVAALQAFFWSGLAAAPLTYWELRRHALWPLFDNLRLPRFVLLGALVGVVELLVLAASLLFFR